MEFRVLGPLEVVEGGRVLPLGTGRQLALVGLLLLHRNETLSVDRIVDELWGESPPATAAKIVRNSVSVLRRELGDRLVTRPPGYLLRVEPGELDSEQLERALERGDLESLSGALSLWRGQPLSQFAYETFAEAEVTRLEDLRLAAIEARIDAQLARGQHAEVIRDLEPLVGKEPLRERLRGQLMLALYRSGRQAEALEVYRQGRRMLDDQLGIEPGPELRELERKILTQDESLAAPAAPAPRLVVRAPTLSRRRAVVLVTIGALAVAAGLAAYLSTRDSTIGLAEIPPNFVGAISPKSNVIVAALPVGLRPGPVIPAAGAVWVGNLGDRTLTRIDPGRHAVIGAVSLGNRTPTGLAFGSSSLWVAHGLRGELSRVEPQFGRLTRTIRVAGRSPSGSVAVGQGSVWVAFGDSTLAHIEPEGVRLSGRALAGNAPAAVVVADGAVWVANSGEATVQRFAPSTFTEGPVRTISVGRQPSAMTYSAGALWVAARGDDSVTRIDPDTASTATIRVGDAPSAITAGGGSIWVANSGDGTVSEIDESTNDVVRTIDVGYKPAGIAFAGELVWVAVQAP